MALDIREGVNPDWVLYPIKYIEGEPYSNNKDYHFWCQGCDSIHVISSAGIGTIWGFNNDMFKPTFTPSYLCGCPDDNGKKFARIRCHSFIKEGQIQYLSDCFHGLKSQTIPLPPIKEWRYL